MWPILRLRALTSLRSFIAPSQTLGSQLPAWTSNFPQSDAAQSQWQQWQQTRGMAVPKRKTSPSRRGHRNAMKFHKFITSVAKCSLCSRLMRPHQIPHYFCERDDCPSKLSSSISVEPASG